MVFVIRSEVGFSECYVTISINKWAKTNEYVREFFHDVPCHVNVRHVCYQRKLLTCDGECQSSVGNLYCYCRCCWVVVLKWSIRGKVDAGKSRICNAGVICCCLLVGRVVMGRVGVGY